MNNQKVKQKICTTLAKILIAIMVFGLFTTQLPLPTAFATENGATLRQTLKLWKLM